MKSKAFIASAALVAVFLSGQSIASTMTFSGSNGSTLAASASFSQLGSKLQVTLSNSSLSDALVPSDVLTGVYFSLSGVPSLTRVSTYLAGGSSVIYDYDLPSGFTGNVGGEFAYKSGLSIASLPGATMGISSSGLGLFGPTDRFYQGSGAYNNLAGPEDPGGIQYGIVSAGDNVATGNKGLTASGGLIRNAVVSVLDGLPVDFLLADIGNVWFQYGSALSEPSFRGTCISNCPPPPPHSLTVPEPSMIFLLGIGLFGFYLARLRRA